MRIKKECFKCCRIFVCLVLAFIIGKVTLRILIANTDAERKVSDKQTYLNATPGKLRAAKNGSVNAVYGQSVLDTAICKEKRLPQHLLTKKDTWLPVDSKQSAYVLNAYFVKSEHKLFVIGAASLRLKSVACLLWYKHSNGSLTVVQRNAGHIHIAEGRRLRYTAHLLMCNLEEYRIPDYVSIVSSHCAKPLHLLRIQNASTPVRPERMFTVCLSPLNYNYSRAYELVEWIELNRIMGAGKFIIYNQSSASNVASVLDFYSKRGITEVVQWRLPMKVQRFKSGRFQDGEIYYFGQLAALNDCLYRQKRYSEFVVNIDADEFIVPHLKSINVWSDILKHLKKEAGAYLFRNVFFRKDWGNDDIVIDNQEKVNKFRLTTLQTLEREKKIYLPRLRSKYFARTADANSLMIHSVNYLPKNRRLAVASEHLALLHHYRNWEENSKDGYIVVEDKTVPDKYSDILVKHVEAIWSALPSGTTLE